MKMTSYEVRVTILVVIAAAAFGVLLQEVKSPPPSCEASGPVVRLFMPCQAR